MLLSGDRWACSTAAARAEHQCSQTTGRPARCVVLRVFDAPGCLLLPPLVCAPCRAVKFFPDSRHDYLQFTLCITSKQRFAAYGKDRALLAGDPGEVLDVTEYCVFERKTVARVKKAQGASMTGVEVNQQTEVEGGRWRLVGWLHP